MQKQIRQGCRNEKNLSLNPIIFFVLGFGFLAEVQLIYRVILFSGIQQWFNIFIHYTPFSYYKILPIFPVLHIISLYLIYFIPSSLYLLTIFSHLAPPPTTLSIVTTSLLFVSRVRFCFVIFIFFSIYKWKHISFSILPNSTVIRPWELLWIP